MDDLKKMMEEAVADILCKELGPQVLHQDVADVDDAVIAEHDVFRQEMLPVAAKIVTAVNALPELIAVKAERDRAQRACEQMGQRITALENSLREIGAAIINGASDTLWMGDQISDETVVDFICNLTGDDPSLLGTFARAALNQEPGQ